MTMAVGIVDPTDSQFPEMTRRDCQSFDAAVLAEVYDDDVHMAVWKRALPAEFEDSIIRFANRRRSFQALLSVEPENAGASIRAALDSDDLLGVGDDIAMLVTMFCDLFETKRAGVRMAVLSGAMCPRFHVDRVPCRLISTYVGSATEWLPHEAADRSKLGRGSEGLSDAESGLYREASHIQRLDPGDVALMKGELWTGNEGGGLIHRSPAVDGDDVRFIVNIDFSS